MSRERSAHARGAASRFPKLQRSFSPRRGNPTLFVVGESETVLKHSRPMILDPLYSHPHESKRIDDPNVRETLKELAQLDGVSDPFAIL